MKCYHCGYEWEYKGNPKAKTITCPSTECNKKISVKKAKELMKK